MSDQLRKTGLIISKKTKERAPSALGPQSSLNKWENVLSLVTLFLTVLLSLFQSSFQPNLIYTHSAFNLSSLVFFHTPTSIEFSSLAASVPVTLPFSPVSLHSPSPLPPLTPFYTHWLSVFLSCTGNSFSFIKTPPTISPPLPLYTKQHLFCLHLSFVSVLSISSSEA